MLYIYLVRGVNHCPFVFPYSMLSSSKIGSSDIYLSPEGTTEIGRGSTGTESAHSERRERINNTRPQGGENPTALPLARPLGNPRPALHTRWRPITAELVFAMLNAGSLLNKTEELANLAQQKNSDIIEVTETWLHDGIRDDEIFLPAYTLFRQDRPSQKKEGALSSTLNPISYLSACCSRPRPPLRFM